MRFRVGLGYDSHRFSPGRKLVLGGIEIPHRMGLAGHSDGDVLCHAVIDALLGAAGLEDIGRHFPDTDETYRDISSLKLLRDVLDKVHQAGYRVINVDVTVITEEPKLSPYIDEMTKRINSIGLNNINIKAKTNEGMGFIGRGEGIAVLAVALLDMIV